MFSEEQFYPEELFNTKYENVKKIFYSPEDFCIHLDGLSLMLEVCQNQHSKWTQNGGVYLHFIYLIERYINMLLKQKSNIKILFFGYVGKLLQEYDPDLYLTYELLIFHLKNLPNINKNLLFFNWTSSDYEYDLRESQCVGLIAFGSFDIELGSFELQSKLRYHFNRLSLTNLNLGICVMLTRDFWHDLDCASAYTLTKIKSSLDLNVGNMFEISFRNEEQLKIDFDDISRNKLYFKALEDSKLFSNEFKRVFILHLYLLESLPLEKRKNSLDVTNFQEEFWQCFEMLKIFKKRLASLLKDLNNSVNDSVREKLNQDSLNGQILKKLCDLFDGRLFYQTYYLLNQGSKLNNFEEYLQDQDYFKKLLNGIDEEKMNYKSHPGKESYLKLNSKIYYQGFKLDNDLFATVLREFLFESSKEPKIAMDLDKAEDQVNYQKSGKKNYSLLLWGIVHQVDIGEKN